MKIYKNFFILSLFLLCSCTTTSKLKKEDIKVDLNKGILTISGERKTKEEVKQEDYYKIETYFGKFSRSFTLPDNVDIENIEAKSDNGVLEIVIPKLKDDVSKKSIEIK